MDRSPLQWLSSQKMIKGLFCRWALAVQGYDFTIKYCKGNLNATADALSHVHPQVSTAATQVISNSFKATVHYKLLSRKIQLPSKSSDISKAKREIMRHQPYIHFHQLWPQLVLQDSVAYCKYSPGPSRGVITVPMVPGCM